MDVILLFNGLGNQMSQYAFYLKKKQISDSARFIFSKKSANIHNGYELDKVFGIKKEDTAVNKILYTFYLGLAYKKLRWFSKPIILFFNLLGYTLFEENDNYNFQPEFLQSSSGIKFY
ncbi:O-fucosyltransferase family protein, partial [Flavitalea flava]